MQDKKSRRSLCIVVTDEDTGEHIATATGVDTMALIVAPDTLRGEEYRRIVIGDVGWLQTLLADTLKDILEWDGSEATLDLSDLLQKLLEEAVQDLPIH